MPNLDHKNWFWAQLWGGGVRLYSLYCMVSQLALTGYIGGWNFANLRDPTYQKMHFQDPTYQKLAFSRPPHTNIGIYEIPRRTFPHSNQKWPPHTKMTKIVQKWPKFGCKSWNFDPLSKVAKMVTPCKNALSLTPIQKIPPHCHFQETIWHQKMHFWDPTYQKMSFSSPPHTK